MFLKIKLILFIFFSFSTFSTLSQIIITPSGPSKSPINHTYTISWNSVGYGFKYTLQECRGSNCNLTPNIQDNSINIKHSYPGMRVYKVKACDSSGCGSFGGSHRVNIYNKPNTTITPTVTSQEGINFKYRVSWPSVINTTFYRLKECKETNCNFTNTDNRYIEISHSYSGVRSYQVQACNEVGCTNWGGSNSIYIYDKPTGNIMPRGNAKVPINASYNIEWDNVKNATDYIIYECKENNCNTTPNIMETKYTHQGQLLEGLREYQVKACNKVGCSNYGGKVNVYIYGKPKKVINTQSPNSMAINTEYKINWEHVPHADSYTLRECLQPDNCNLTPNIISTSYMHSGHQTKGKRSYQIQACNIVGCGDFGNISGVDIYDSAPQAPYFLSTMTSEATLYHPFDVLWSKSNNTKHYKLKKCNYNYDTCENISIDASKAEYEITLNRGDYNIVSFFIEACNELGCSSSDEKPITITTSNKIKSALIYVGYQNNGGEVLNTKIDWSSTSENIKLINKMGSSGINRLVVLPTVHVPVNGVPYYSYETSPKYKDQDLINSTKCEVKTLEDINKHNQTIENFSLYKSDLDKILNLIRKSDYKDKIKIWISTPPTLLEYRYYPDNSAVQSWVEWLTSNYLIDSSSRKLVDGIYMSDENFWVCSKYENKMLNYMVYLRDKIDSEPLTQKLHYIWAPHRGAIYKNGELATRVRTYSKLQAILSNGESSVSDWNIKSILQKYGETPIFDYIFLQPNVMLSTGWENAEQLLDIQWENLLIKVNSWILNQRNYETSAMNTYLGLDMEVDRDVCLPYKNKARKYKKYESVYLDLMHRNPQESPVMFYFDMKHPEVNTPNVLSYETLVDLITDYYNGNETNVACFYN